MAMHNRVAKSEVYIVHLHDEDLFTVVLIPHMVVLS